MDKFRNIEYDYKTVDDAFIARGLHLNQLVDEINGAGNVTEDILTGATQRIDIGRSDEIDAVIIDYSIIFPGSPAIGANYDQSGTIIVNNSSEHLLNAELSWTRESINHGGTGEDDVVITFEVSNSLLKMVLVNNNAYTMDFSYTAKTINHGISN